MTDILVCDVFATKGDGEAIVEIETGFTPPEHALDPTSYYVARIASKISMAINNGASASGKTIY